MLDQIIPPSCPAPQSSLEPSGCTVVPPAAPHDTTTQQYMKLYRSSSVKSSNSASSASGYATHSEYCACSSSGVGCQCTKSCDCGPAN
ncbi:hypothetical protein EV182_006343, partial [Spiromyces aspiralis]